MLTVIAVVIGVGAPAFGNLLRNNRIAADTNDMVIGMHAGRSAAVKQRAPVVICASDDPTAPTPSCGTNYANGWVVFVDRNSNGQIDADPDPTLDETVIEAHGPMRQGLSVAADNSYLAFSPAGFGLDIPGLGASASNVLVCDDRGNADLGGGRSAARLIAVTATGRPQVLNSVAEINTRTGGCP